MDVRSVRSDQRCFVRFINSTDRTVEVTWINFAGAYVRYQILEKGSYVDVNTFKTHPWMVKDIATKDHLHIEKNFLYYPKTTREFLSERFPGKEVPENYETRVRAYITLPLYSLRYMTLLEVRNYFTNSEDVDQLELPKNLAEQLKLAILRRNAEHQTPISQYQGAP